MSALSLEATFESDVRVEMIANVVETMNDSAWAEIEQQTHAGGLRAVDELDTSGRDALTHNAQAIGEALELGASDIQRAAIFLGAHPNRKGNRLGLLWRKVENPRKHASLVAQILTGAGSTHVSASTLTDTGAVDVFEPE